MSTEAAANPSTTEGKTCFVCGINLSGKPRRKDDKGRYWCVPCSRGTDAQNAEAAKKSTTVQCPDCGKSLPRSVMVKFGADLLICEPCRDVREKEHLRAQARREDAARGGEEERKQHSRLIYLLIVAGVLAVFTLYWNFHK